MAVGILEQFDWKNALGMPPIEPDPKVEVALAELRANTTQTHIDEKRNLTRNLVMLMFTLSGLLATTGIIRQGQEQQKDKQVVSAMPSSGETANK